MYSCPHPANTTLDKFRFASFNGRVRGSKREVELSSLPLTKSAAEQHYYRTALQIAVWKGQHFDPAQ